MPTRFDPSRVRLICLDIDGTLADTDDAFVVQAARGLGFLRLIPQLDPVRLARMLVMRLESPATSLITLVDRLGLDEASAPFEDLWHRMSGEAPASHYRPIEGILPALDVLRSHYPLAIVTARSARSAAAFLNQSAVQGTFACAASAGTCRRTKPDPASLLWTAQQIGVTPGECLMVGDTTVDILAGVRAGAQTVGVLCGFGEKDELERAGADLILESTADLPEALGLRPRRAG
jgi:HAD superfamily hydrolase (TIGR01509 family)